MLHLRSFWVQSRACWDFSFLQLQLMFTLDRTPGPGMLEWNRLKAIMCIIPKVNFCLKYQTQRTEFQEVRINWNDGDICLIFTFLFICGQTKGELRQAFSEHLLHFCLVLRIIMLHASNPQATHEQSYIAAITKLANTKNTKKQQQCSGSIWAARIPFLGKVNIKSLLFTL